MRPSTLDWILLALIIAALPLAAAVQFLPMPGRMRGWGLRFQADDGKRGPVRALLAIAVVAWTVGGYVWLEMHVH